MLVCPQSHLSLNERYEYIGQILYTLSWSINNRIEVGRLDSMFTFSYVSTYSTTAFPFLVPGVKSPQFA